MADSRPAAYSAALPAVVGSVPDRIRPNVRLLLLLALGHCVVGPRAFTKHVFLVAAPRERT